MTPKEKFKLDSAAARWRENQKLRLNSAAAKVRGIELEMKEIEVGCFAAARKLPDAERRQFFDAIKTASVLPAPDLWDDCLSTMLFLRYRLADAQNEFNNLNREFVGYRSVSQKLKQGEGR